MKQKNIGFAVSLLLALASGLAGQQEFYITLKEGVPATSLALPNFATRSSSVRAKTAAAEIRQVLAADLGYSRIFQLLPEKYYDYIRPIDPSNIFFKDWESIQASILFVGEISEAAGDDVVFEGKLYDVKGGRFIFGKRYQYVMSNLDETVLREIASLTRGRYFRAESNEALARIYAEIDQLERTEVSSVERVDYHEAGLRFLLPAALLLLLEFLLAHTLLRSAL